MEESEVVVGLEALEEKIEDEVADIYGGCRKGVALGACAVGGNKTLDLAVVVAGIIRQQIDCRRSNRHTRQGKSSAERQIGAAGTAQLAASGASQAPKRKHKGMTAAAVTALAEPLQMLRAEGNSKADKVGGRRQQARATQAGEEGGRAFQEESVCACVSGEQARYPTACPCPGSPTAGSICFEIRGLPNPPPPPAGRRSRLPRCRCHLAW